MATLVAAMRGVAAELERVFAKITFSAESPHHMVRRTADEAARSPIREVDAVPRTWDIDRDVGQGGAVDYFGGTTVGQWVALPIVIAYPSGGSWSLVARSDHSELRMNLLTTRPTTAGIQLWSLGPDFSLEVREGMMYATMWLDVLVEHT